MFQECVEHRIKAQRAQNHESVATSVFFLQDSQLFRKPILVVYLI